MRHGILTAVLFGAVLMAGPVAAKPWGFSRDAVGVDTVATQESVSPNGTSRVRATALNGTASARLIVTGAIGQLTFETLTGPKAELLWAPDSKALFVTAPRADAPDAFGLTVIDPAEGGLRRRDLTAVVEPAFEAGTGCAGKPDVAGIMWLGRSDRILVSAQHPPQPGCETPFQVYDVDLKTMKILRTYAQQDAVKVFGGAMGLRLLQAADKNTVRVKDSPP